MSPHPLRACDEERPCDTCNGEGWGHQSRGYGKPLQVVACPDCHRGVLPPDNPDAEMVIKVLSLTPGGESKAIGPLRGGGFIETDLWSTPRKALAACRLDCCPDCGGTPFDCSHCVTEREALAS